MLTRLPRGYAEGHIGEPGRVYAVPGTETIRGMEFGVTATLVGIDLQVVGVILMIVGVAGLAITFALLQRQRRRLPPPPPRP